MEENKEIFDFMGCVHSNNEEIDKWEMEKLKYHTSWDWLMPVVEKIEYEANVTICRQSCHIENDDILIERYGDTKIESIYLAVVAFIKWHNEQKGIEK